MAWKELDLSTLNFNPFHCIGKDWFLLTAGNINDFNTMTASWGGVGVMWRKNIFTSVIRPTRHTYKFVEDNPTFTISFFDEQYRDALTFCGSNSGRTVDKIAATNLSPVDIEENVAFKEASLVLRCKKIYRTTIDEESFLDESIWNFYRNEPFHVAYTSEILGAFLYSEE